MYAVIVPALVRVQRSSIAASIASVAMPSSRRSAVTHQPNLARCLRISYARSRPLPTAAWTAIVAEQRGALVCGLGARQVPSSSPWCQRGRSNAKGTPGMKLLKIGAASAALMAVLAGVAYGAGVLSTADTNVVTACAQKNNGQLRLVSAASDCRSSENAVQWNQVGPAGPKGDTGGIGPAGPAGPTGATGATGATSTIAGPQGLKGDLGNPGATGPQGQKGDTGAQGPAGPPGSASTVPGPQGPAGLGGQPGPVGPMGPQGQAGASGLSGYEVVRNTVDNSPYYLDVHCSPGKHVLGGGGVIPSGGTLQASQPTQDNAGWRIWVQWSLIHTTFATAYAICADE
jgi:hypothetical protein